jgi:hypothetical protein
MAVVPVACAKTFSRFPRHWSCLDDLPASHVSLFNAVQFFRCGAIIARRDGGAIIDYCIKNRNATMYGMNAIWVEYGDDGEEISAHCDAGVGGPAPPIEKRLLDQLFQGPRGNFLLTSEGYEHAMKLYDGNSLPDGTVMAPYVMGRILAGVTPPAFALLTFSMSVEEAQEKKKAEAMRQRETRPSRKG